MRVYRPWYTWECYENGMWRKVSGEDEAVLLKKAIRFTGNHERYGRAMKAVTVKWKNTMLHFLTNPSVNKKAHIGHCAAQYAINCPEYITRRAWWMLTDEQRRLADEQAMNCYRAFMDSLKCGYQLKIDHFEREGTETYKDLAG